MRCPRCRHVNEDDSRFCAGCGAALALASPSPEVSQTLTSPPASKKWAAGQTLAGKYAILGELGRGGMGEVYLAEDMSLDRKAALKFLPEATYRDPATRGRFVREAKAAAALSHPYICSIYEVGEVEDKLFFAMEYVEGKTLRERIAQGPLPLAEALAAAVEIAEALRVAHEKGLIHRDIKPANIMLTSEGHAKVMDFGLAKHFAKAGADTTVPGGPVTITDEGLTPGTPAYMSPEQLRGKALDQRSDIFSFGIVLYEMLSGRHPFKRETGLTTVSAILTEEPLPIAGVIEGLPEGLQGVIGRMLAKDADRRYPSMAEVHAGLKTVLADVQGPKAIRFLKPLRMALTAAAVAVAVVGGAWLAKTLFFKTPARALAFQERDWIMITDFENLTGEQVFDGSLETALLVSIQQSQYVNVFPPSRVQETLKRMRRTDVRKIDEAVGREIAIREGIKGLLVCGIGKIGGDYLLTAKIVDPDRQTTVFSDSARTKRKEDILASVDSLAKKVRHGLGESMARITERQLALIQATTSSLEALKYYSSSIAAPQDMTIQMLKQAVELDPDFALAHAMLGMRYYMVGRRVEGEAHFGKALGLLDRLTTREKLWIKAIVEDWRGNREQGIQDYRAYLAQYPDDTAAWYRLGYAHMISDRPEPAVEAFKRVIELDRDSSGAYINLATCYSNMKKNEEALAHYQKAFSLNPEDVTGIYVNNEYGFLLVRLGRMEEAEKTFKMMIVQPESWKRSKGYRSLALFQMYRGKYEAALEDLREAVGLNKSMKAWLSEFRDHLHLAIAYRKKGRNEDSGRELAAAERIQTEVKIEPLFLAKLGTLYARTNRIGEAERVLGTLESAVGELLAASGMGRSEQSDQAAYHRLKGEIELARGRYEEALGSFGIVANLMKLHVDDSLALTYLKSGNIDKAIEKYKEFIETDVLGYEAQEAWVLAHYVLGGLWEKKAEGAEARAEGAAAKASAEAAKYYERFLEIWKDADPDLPEVAAARLKLKTALANASD